MRYVFTGTDGTTRTGTTTVSQNAENAWEQLTLSTDIDRPGTLTVSVVSYDQAQIYFDDLTVSQDIGPIVQEGNFYAYGMPMPDISWSRPNFQRENSGYQGLYAQYDESTKLNSFQLRMYDARVGRWLSKDPYRQHNSPYVGMSNNPTNSIDPNGGYSWAGAALRSTFAQAIGKDPGSIYDSQTERGWGFEAGGAHYFSGPIMKEISFNVTGSLSAGVQAGEHIMHLEGLELNLFSASLVKGETNFKYSFETDKLSFSDPKEPYRITPVWRDSEIKQSVELDAPILPPVLGLMVGYEHSFMYSDPQADKSVIEASFGTPLVGYTQELDLTEGTIEPSMSGSVGAHAILGADLGWKIKYE